MIDPRRNSTYKRPFTEERNYLVFLPCWYLYDLDYPNRDKQCLLKYIDLYH